MSQEQSQTQSAAQAGPSGEAAGVGSAVGGVHSRRAMSWKGESGNITPEHLASDILISPGIKLSPLGGR